MLIAAARIAPALTAFGGEMSRTGGMTITIMTTTTPTAGTG